MLVSVLPGDMRGKRPTSRVVWLAGMAVLAGAACGQYAGVHEQRAAAGRPAMFGVLVRSAPVERRSFQTLDGATTRNDDSSDRASGRDVTLVGDGPLHVCPVQGRGYYTSSFAAYRPGPPVHPHEGNDMFAAQGSPIVAPFDGDAVAAPNQLGGRAVKVYGDGGYVYNAHLAAYGDLGRVRAGDVIGYVGTSGNAYASAPHNHFEWHPGNGPAVDPFPFLNEVCSETG
jgi:murein DD-endopeptidase MepM/ murein hydrolase activator NlpD